MNNNWRWLILGVIILLCTCCGTKPAHVGLWRLHAMEVRNEHGDWTPYKNGMEGYLLYDSFEHMTLHLWQKGFKEYANPYDNFTSDLPLADLQNHTKSYYYIGAYTILNDSVVQHTRISHSNPKDWGETVQRKFVIHKDTLEITPVEQTNANLKLTWLRSQ